MKVKVKVTSFRTHLKHLDKKFKLEGKVWSGSMFNS